MFVLDKKNLLPRLKGVITSEKNTQCLPRHTYYYVSRRIWDVFLISCVFCSKRIGTGGRRGRHHNSPLVGTSDVCITPHHVHILYDKFFLWFIVFCLKLQSRVLQMHQSIEHILGIASDWSSRTEGWALTVKLDLALLNALRFPIMDLGICRFSEKAPLIGNAFHIGVQCPCLKILRHPVAGGRTSSKSCQGKRKSVKDP